MKMKTQQNFSDVAEAVLRGKFVALNVYIRKEERSNNHLSFYLRILEKEEQVRSKVNRRKIIKIRVKIYQIENRKILKPKLIKFMLTSGKTHHNIVKKLSSN